MKNYTHITQSDYEMVAGSDWPSFMQFQTQKNIPQFVYDEVDQMLRPSTGFKDSNFCMMPFYNLETRFNTPCCYLPLNSNIEKIKENLLDGNRPVECNVCWKLEDVGMTSDRIIKNSALDYYTGRDLEFLIEDARQGKNKVLSYKIDTDNTCNAACVTCDSESSSLWGQLLKKNNLKYTKNWKIRKENLLDKIDFQHAKIIIFRGGESTLSKTNFWILEKLLEHNNTTCFVSFTTNGGFNFNQSQIQLLKKFTNINFSFSIDGIDFVFDYMRWPLKWQTILDNISWCQQNNFSVSSVYTLSNLNLYYYQQTVQWFKTNNIDYLLNFVDTPKYFSTTSLPQTIKQKLHTELGIEKSWLSHSSADDKQFQIFLEEMHKQDALKGPSIKQYLPEFADMLNI